VTAASFFRDITAFSVQIALVVVAIAVLVRLVRVPARVRYLSLRLALAATLVAPWLLRAPEMQGRTSPAIGTKAVSFLALPPAGTGSSAPVSAAMPVAPLDSSPAIPWTRIVLGVLFTGVVARALWLAVGVFRLLRLKRRGLVVDVPEYSELQQQLGTCATIAQVPGLSQPATFGILRPIVLLPDAMASAAASLRHAVVTHELFHVRRRDWLSVLVEEMVRTVLWFHPAILWMTSQIQLAREEIVDELTVRATGDRRTYVEALLAFADTPGLSPAPAFAHRRQLFHRILSVSKEKVMSRPRMLSSAAVLLAAVVGASWYASTLFPILTAATAEVMAPALLAAGVQASTQSGSRVVLDGNVELRAGDMRSRASRAELLLEQRTGDATAARAVTPENPIPRRTRGVTPARPAQFGGAQVVVRSLVTLDRNGAVTAVVRDGCSVTDGRTSDNAVCAAFFDAVSAAIRQWRYDRPAQGPIQFYVTITFRPGAEPTVTQSGEGNSAGLRETQDRLRLLAEQTRRGHDRVATEELLRARLEEMIAQLRELERAQRLALERGPANPDLVKLQQELAQLNDARARAEGRLQEAKLDGQQAPANLERRAFDERNRALLEEQFRAREAEMAERMREVEQLLVEARAQLRQAENGRQPAPATTASVSLEPAPLPGSTPLVSPSGRTPIRVSDVPGMKPPTVRKRVKPEHPLAAMKARVEGTVVLEAVVDEQGRVADVRVTKSIPLLDQAAMDAARQWEFTPTLMNGEPVPVLLMLEMNFTLK